jgi:hypothetical protein
MRYLDAFVLSLIILLLGPASLLAGPVLMGDPYPLTGLQPTGFVVVLDEGTPREVPPKKYPDGTLGLWYELGEIADGVHTVKVKAVKTADKSGNKSATRLESPWAATSFRKTGAQIVRIKGEAEKLPPTRTFEYLKDKR